jgi:hypothetical protein
MHTDVHGFFLRGVDEGDVRFGEAVVDGVGGMDPAGVGDGEELDRAGEPFAEEGVEADVGVGVVVVDEGEFTEGADGDAEFFGDFTDGAGFGGFAGVALAAGEFPVAAEDGVGFAFADEELLVGLVEDDGDGDFDGAGGR